MQNRVPPISERGVTEANEICMQAMQETAARWSELVSNILQTKNPWDALGLYQKWLSEQTESCLAIGEKLGRVWMKGSGEAPSAGRPTKRHGYARSA